MSEKPTALFLQRCLRYLKFGLKHMFCLSLVLLVFAICVDQGIALYTKPQIYQDINKLPYRPYAVVLGTAKYASKNRVNLFYRHRLLAAQALYEQKKVDYLLLSGDNRTLQYNEPRTMFNDLRKAGIPTDKMYMDFAGFRTLDSIMRAKQVFQAHSMTIVTQQFHCERALFIAKYHNIDAICFAAADPDDVYWIRIREVFARVRAVLDILLGKAPHFLGEPEPLPSPE